MRRFPNGYFVDLAHTRIEGLRAKAAATPAVEVRQ